MKSIAERWLDFDQHVLAKDAPPIQHDEMQRAFYAGCATMIDVENEVAAIRDDILCVIILETIYREVFRFGTTHHYGPPGGHYDA
jgi:hypothetical protein